MHEIRQRIPYLLQRSRSGNRIRALYKGKFSEIEDEYETKGEKPNSKTTKIKGKFYDRDSDGNWRLMLDTDAEGVNEDKIKNFFTTVQEPGTTSSKG